MQLQSRPDGPDPANSTLFIAQRLIARDAERAEERVAIEQRLERVESKLGTLVRLVGEERAALSEAICPPTALDRPQFGQAFRRMVSKEGLEEKAGVCPMSNE